MATGNVLISGGAGAPPTYGKVGLTTHVSGVLPIINGGTNSSTPLSGKSLMVSNGSAIVQAPLMTDGQIIVGKNGDAPQQVLLGGDATINNTGSLLISNDAVTTPKILNSAVSTSKIADDAVTKEKLNADVAGIALIQAVDGSLDVITDNSTLETNADLIRVKDLGISTAKLADNAVTTIKITDANVTYRNLVPQDYLMPIRFKANK
ncbi:MAG: hypothetical protein IPH69_03715 [Bacteroidales bacterium]|nr:hypothetical protein [Bacteroidales bacterium]